jgi:hypothetical protein
MVIIACYATSALLAMLRTQHLILIAFGAVASFNVCRIVIEANVYFLAVGGLVGFCYDRFNLPNGNSRLMCLFGAAFAIDVVWGRGFMLGFSCILSHGHLTFQVWFPFLFV